MQIIAYQEGTKINTEVNEEYWYTLDYKAPLISASTSFLQPSPRRSITWMVVALCHWSVCACVQILRLVAIEFLIFLFVFIDFVIELCKHW